MPEPLWTPSSERMTRAAMNQFRELAQATAARPLQGYFDLHRWTVEEPAQFWELYARYASLPFDTPPRRIIGSKPMPNTSWFEGATLNYAHALLYPAALASDGQPAILACDESGNERELSYRELRREVARVQRALLSEGVGPGDRVAAFASNVPETVVVLLACAGIGAIFTSCSPDFGLDAALSRFGQVRPKVLLVSPVYRYGGRRYSVVSLIAELTARLDLERAVALPVASEGDAWPGLVAWEEWLPSEGGEPTLTPLPFDHPLYVLYSSGTTGLPKAIVHRAGGALLSHHKEHRLHSDIGAGDRVLYFSTCGWMMWNWLVSALAQAATIVLFDGAPNHPDLEALWRLAERLGITFFGTSARYLHSLQAAAVTPSRYDLEPLRTIASTGSPLSPGGFEYVYREVKKDVHLASISGGTDIVSCFMLGVPTLPVYSGQIQAPGLGVDLAAFGDDGEPVLGQPGELVCRQPLPSMPLRFWDDEGDRRYHRAYFERFEGVWHHGDLIETTQQGGIVVYGRSDATLNPGGVRIGTAEIYRPLDSVPEVLEAVAVGKRIDGDEEIWLFVVLDEGRVLDDSLTNTIRQRIRADASPRHVPRRIVAVGQLPRTRSGKSMEIAVSKLVNGHEVGNRSVVANPEALEEIARTMENLPDRAG